MTNRPPSDERIDLLIVERLLGLYAWPEAAVPIHRLTVDELLAHRPEPRFLERTKYEPSLSWHCRRTRFFYDELQSGHALDPIVVDNVCSGSRIYPEPIVIDGHHRLIAARLGRTLTIPASYSGRVDSLHYLTGKSDCPPES